MSNYISVLYDQTLRAVQPTNLNINVGALTASTGILVGPSTDATAQFYISASNANIAAIEVDNSSGVETFQLSQTIMTVRVPIQSSYVTLTTGSVTAPNITCSFLDPKEYVTFHTGSITYTFTSSNVPASGIYATTTLYINNTNASTNTASLSFPAGWKWLGLTPTYITASKDAELNLESFGGNVVAVWAPQY